VSDLEDLVAVIYPPAEMPWVPDYAEMTLWEQVRSEALARDLSQLFNKPWPSEN
jgi:hypothetical protein